MEILEIGKINFVKAQKVMFLENILHSIQMTVLRLSTIYAIVFGLLAW